MTYDDTGGRESGTVMDDDTRAQLSVLATLADRFAAQRMRFWLRGGWAVDFLLGEITRRHADVDIVTWQRHRRRVHRVLLDAGFVLTRETEVQSDYRAQGQDVSVIYLTRLPDGRIVTHGIPVWTWPDGSLMARSRRLAGLAAYVVSPAQLLWEKESYEGGTGRPLRPKDIESMRVLRGMIDGRRGAAE
jgi:hypothetical protein